MRGCGSRAALRHVKPFVEAKRSFPGKGWCAMKKTLTVVGLFLVLSGCSNSPPAFKVVPESEKIGDPAAPAVVILIDTSGSMSDSVPDKTGDRRPKHHLAREALDRIVHRVGDWK